MVRLRRSLALLAFAVLAAAPHAGAAVLGNQTVEAKTGQLQNVGAAFPVTAAAQATYTKIVAYVEATAGGPTLSAGIYDDGGGHPGTLLASGAVARPVANSWNEVAIPATTLSAGRYWLALLGSGGTVKYRFAGTSLSEDDLDRGLNALPQTWTTGTVRSRAPFSVYATAPPTLQVSPSGLSFTAVGGAAPAAATLSVANGGEGLLDWIATTDAPWLSVFPQSGVGDGATAVGVSAAGLPPGTYHGAVTVSAAGAQGSPAAVPVTLTVTDATPPSVRVTAPADGAAVRGAVDVGADAADDVGVAGVQFRLDGLDLGAEDTTAPYSVPWPTGAVADGAHALTAVARDDAGNQAVSAPVAVRVDNAAPTVSITAPRGPVNVTSPNPFAVTAASPDADVAQVELFSCTDASPGCATGAWTSLGVDTSAPYSAQWPLPADGNRALRAVATDATGNTGTDVLDVPVDRTVPTGTLTAPAAGAALTGTAVLTADATDFGSGVASVRFERLAAGASTWIPIATVAAAPYSTTLATTTVADGAYGLRAVVTDLAGNSAASVSVPVSVDNAAPTVAISAPRASVDATAANPFTVTATTPDADVLSVAFAACSDASTGCATGTWTALGTDATAPYTASWPLPADGNRALRAVAADAGGNTGTAVADVTVDRTPPTGSVTAPAAGSTVSGVVSVTAGASDNLGVAGVQLLLDGAALGAEDTSAPYSASWDTSTAAAGSHTLAARVRDGVGNTVTTAAVTVTVGSAAPPPPPPPPPAGLDTTNAWKRITVGPGFVDATARQVVRTAGDQVYVFAADDTAAVQALGPGVIHAYKGDVAGIPGSFAEVDAANRPRAAANNNSKLAGVDLRLDRSGIVHMVYVDNSAPITLEYRTFDTRTDRWGPKETIASGLAQQLRGRMKYALILDDADRPHVVYMAGTSVVYTNRVVGTWSAPQTLATTPNPLHPTLAADAAGNFYLAWLDDGTNPSKIFFKKRAADGTWSANETVVSADVLTNANADQGPSLVVTPSGKVALLYVSALPASAVRVKVRATDGTWTQDPLPTDIFTHTPQIYSRGEDLYVFLGHDAQISYGYTYKLAGQGWAPYAKLTNVADDGSASIRWDPQRETNPNVIDTANFNEDTLHNRTFLPEVYYFAALPQGSATSTPADTVPPATSVTAPAAGATLSGTTTISASASDDVGVAGVQFKLDGALLGAEDTAAPYSVAWDTTTAVDGTHTLTAVARDAAGNVGTASTTVTVANAAPATTPAPAPLPASGLVAAYGFDAGQGLTLADSSGLGNVGTLDGPTWAAAGHAGGALSFDGLNDVVSVADADSLDLTSGMTLEAWVKPSALGTAWRTVLMKEDATRLVYALYANSNTSRPVGDVYSNGFFDPRGTAQLPLDTWTHLAVTFDGASVSILVNGTVAATRTVGGAMLPSAGALRIGGNSIVGEYFAGLIDDVRIYDRALSVREIQADMTRAVAP